MSVIAQSLPVDGAIETGDRRRRIIAIVGASSGNLVEWYDFYAYAFTSIYFAAAFFPTGDATSQLLATAGIFAVGFFMRPLGGWLFGWIADTNGRRTSMGISVLMMCAGSLMIAIMPTYQTVGALAPVALLVARLVQGLSVGGEYGTAATYMSEVASKGNRGFYSSFQYVTLIGGQLLALLVLVVLQALLDVDHGKWDEAYAAAGDAHVPCPPPGAAASGHRPAQEASAHPVRLICADAGHPDSSRPERTRSTAAS